jgi:hypothetical protein
MRDREKPSMDIEKWILRGLLAAVAALFVAGTVGSRHEIVRYIKISRM